MKNLLLAFLAALSSISASAQGLSDSQIEVERLALYQSCLAKFQPGSSYTQRGFETLCRCSAGTFFSKMPIDVAESLLRGEVTHQSVLLHRDRVGQYCVEAVQKRQLALPPGTLLTNTQNDVGGVSGPSHQTASPNNPQSQGGTLSLDGAACSIDAGGLIRCNNGLTCMRDASALIRCNNGLSFSTDTGGLTRFNDGTSAITDKGGLTRYSNGTASTTDSSGLTRFSDGTYCTRDASGLTRCTKRQGLLD